MSVLPVLAGNHDYDEQSGRRRLVLAVPGLWADLESRTAVAAGQRLEPMITRPMHLNAYEFVVVASLRAQQLLAGSTPRLAGDHSPATMAQMEVANGLVKNVFGDGDGLGEPAQKVDEPHSSPPDENPV